jgi:hypothetical protein
MAMQPSFITLRTMAASPRITRHQAGATWEGIPPAAPPASDETSG